MAVVHSSARDIDQAEDLFQEVWTSVFEKRASFECRGAFSAWLNRIAHHVSVMGIRAQKARESVLKLVEVEGRGEDLGWTPVDALAETERGEFRARLRTALAELPKRQEQAFVLTRIEGLSVDEAAEAIGTNAGTVRSNVRHALKKLRLSLEDLSDDMSLRRSHP